MMLTPHLSRSTTLFALMVLTASLKLTAAPGDLDFGFGTAGSVTTDFVDSTDVGMAMKVLGDGKILVAGRTHIGGINHFGLVRYHQNGTLDTNFGIAGKVTLLIGTQCEANAIDVQEDGKILVAGSARVSEKWVFAVARFTADGDLDTEFSVDGIVTAAPVTLYTSHNYCKGVAILTDGKIVLGGYAETVRYGSVPYGRHACAVCLRENGDHDPEFGTGGVSAVPYSQPIGAITSIGLQEDADGNPLFILGGVEGTGGGASPNFSIYRLLSDGPLDPIFGTNGKVVIDFFGQQDSIASVVVQPDGRILAVGTTWSGTENRVAIIRLHHNGSLDSGFGDNGKVTLLHPDGNFNGSDAVVQPDGRILISGTVSPVSANPKMSVVRLHHNGTVDTSFGSNGITTVAVPDSTEDVAKAIAIQSYNGPVFSYRVLAAGSSRINGESDFSVVGVKRGALGAPPSTIGVPSVVGVTAGGASFTVAVNPNGSHTTVILEYGLTGEPPSQMPLSLAPSDGNQFQLVEHRLTGLVPDKDYVVRSVAESDAGRVFSADTPFRTLKRPVVFVPGIAGSVLNEYWESQGQFFSINRWPAVLDSGDIDRLNLNGGAPDIRAVDVVRSVFGKDIYGEFITKWTTDLGYTEYLLEGQPDRITSPHMLTLPIEARPTFFVFPYDWRKSNTKHTQALNIYIQNIRTLHDGVKVNILAHSMGSLLTRRLLMDHGGISIDRVVTVGSPLWGAPRAVYIILSGRFFEHETLNLDFFHSRSMRGLAASAPGVHELLPSSLYSVIDAAPLFAEDNWDFDRNGRFDDGFLIPAYSRTKTMWAIDSWTQESRGGSIDKPSITNDTFHSSNGHRQDDWSQDSSAVRYLHIAGQLDSADTTKRVMARTFFKYTKQGWLIGSSQDFEEVRINAGDGTVPVISAIRREEFCAPNTEVRVVTGPKKDKDNPRNEVNHNALMNNLKVTEMIEAFFEGADVPYSESVPVWWYREPPQAHQEITESQSESLLNSHQEIFILGAGYANVTDSEGNTNALFSEIAAQRVPGVEAEYGGEDLWCRLQVEPDVALTLSGASPAEVVEILVSQIGSDGSTLSTRRFLIQPNEKQWQFTLSAAGMAHPTEPTMIVDTNDDGTFDPEEAVPPTHSADGVDVDVTPPQVTLDLSTSGPSIVSTLISQDNRAGAKAFYSFDGGPITEYSLPLEFPPGSEGILRAFAEDSMGNRSGLITTTVRPNVQIKNSGPMTITLDWPVAEGYILEQASSPEGPWTQCEAGIQQKSLTESAEITIQTHERAFFRLRTQAVTR